MKTTIAEMTITKERNTFKLPASDFDKYVDVVIKTSDEKTGHSAQMSFLRDVENEAQDSPSIKDAIKKCVDMTTGSVIHYLKSKGDERFKDVVSVVEKSVANDGR